MSERSKSVRIGRRAFLKTGGFATLGLAAGAFRAPALFAATRARTVGRGSGALLSVGFASLPDERNPAPRLVPADTLLSGDPTFISRFASVTVSGYSRATRQRGASGGLIVDAIFPALSYTPEKFPRFQAWTMSGRETGDAFGAPLHFTIPVTSTQGLQFAVRRMGAEAGDETPVVLALDSSPDSMKLQRGVYVFAFRETPQDEMLSWSSYRVSEKNGAMMLDASTFSWVSLVIDYAK